MPWPASAADLDLTVSPVSFNYSPRPGDVIKEKVSVHNNTSAPLTLNLSVNKMVVDEKGNVAPEEMPASDPATGWIKFNSPKIVTPVKEWYEVPFTITIPADAAYGNYFALVFSPPSGQPDVGTTVVQGNILVPILLNVQKEGAIRQASITEFKVKNFVTQYLPVDFFVSVKNTGNVHVHPRGNIFIRGSNQKDLAVLEVNAGQSNILPEASRTFTASWNDGFLVRDASNHLSINWNKLTDFRLGKYSAYVLLAYDDGLRDVPIESTLTFWVFPYAAVAVILIAVGFVTFIIIYGFRSLVKKEARKLK